MSFLISTFFVCNKGPCLCFSAEHQPEEESLAVNRGFFEKLCPENFEFRLQIIVALC